MYVTPVINQFPFSGNANIDNNCFMENREQQILSEIKSMVASIRSQLEKLDAKMVEFHQTVDPEGFKKESINVIIDDIDMLARPLETEVVEIPLELDIPAEPVIEPAAEPVDEPEAVTVAESDDDLPFGDLRVEEDDDLPGFFSVPEPVTVSVKASVARPTINDAHSADQAWRKDMPGSPVKDIRSAISLNDRVFFINNLFDEDAQAFVNALSSINAMSTLDEVVAFVTEQYPHWDLNSDIVYRFMMAVRRKVSE